MSDTVIREVCANVWTFSKPFSRFGFLPIGGRSTAIKLRDGGIWVLASTPLNEETKATIDKLGPVRYIVGGNAVHRLFLSDFKKAYPDAKLIAPQAAIDGYHDPSTKFDGAWGSDHPDTKYGFEDEVKHCYFEGFRNKDVAFFHHDSKSLIEADLLFNLPAHEQYSKSNQLAHIPVLGLLLRPSFLNPRVAWGLAHDKEAMKNHVKTIESWEFERIIPCHGDVIEKDAKAAWREAYRAHYD
ncbi:hypothetical protein M378DRAFT_133232 [Amanita muscaria Koide BX008]|uniref:DUF4336 domain-containing protein n=1 Tax=Amanita muscaria (strain Koide BX008) TaxID=946122 RepID=A0A0C2WLJ6_AMAMK|nr:hypothetical protein M378DRAFT_133232 [Amanita muscaria Koide BX008]